MFTAKTTSNSNEDEMSHGSANEFLENGERSTGKIGESIPQDIP